MMKPPKEISKAKIPRKTIIISYAVIYATSLPMYSLARGGYHPVMGTFQFKILS